MAAVFLVTLYEYSPLFYISVVSLCFIVTAAMVLGWFGFDVPVILRSSDETESILPTPEKQMVQVTNPFALQICSGPASLTDGVSVRTCCLEPCVLTCFWGCEVSTLQAGLQAHQHGPRFSTPQQFKEALHYHCCQSFKNPLQYKTHKEQEDLIIMIFSIHSEDGKEYHTQVPADQCILNFGPLPRKHYPLVAVLTLAEPEARATYNIVASVTIIHVPDDKYSLSGRILFQYLLTSQGKMYELQPLFMSADSGSLAEPPVSDMRAEPSEHSAMADMMQQNPVPAEDEGQGKEDWSEERKKDCVVCQNAAVNRVLLPCRHACVCDSCVSHFQHCPICRAFVLESFTLTL